MTDRFVIASVQANSGNDARYEKLESKNGKFYFTLKAGNHQVIGNSQMYASAATRDAGIESVKANGGSEVRAVGVNSSPCPRTGSAVGFSDDTT